MLLSFWAQQNSLSPDQHQIGENLLSELQRVLPLVCTDCTQLDDMNWLAQRASDLYYIVIVCEKLKLARPFTTSSKV